MRQHKKITTQNLRRLAWSRGFHGVAGLARGIGKSRVAIYSAVREPHRFRPTMKKLSEVLL
ncbi:MAG: hypothetical protein KGL39_47775 [Patescibacteria group bacterium]|nr:hypothetical protein [Patescibacteria group bacterium]